MPLMVSLGPLRLALASRHVMRLCRPGPRGRRPGCRRALARRTGHPRPVAPRSANQTRMLAGLAYDALQPGVNGVRCGRRARRGAARSPGHRGQAVPEPTWAEHLGLGRRALGVFAAVVVALLLLLLLRLLRLRLGVIQTDTAATRVINRGAGEDHRWVKRVTRLWRPDQRRSARALAVARRESRRERCGLRDCRQARLALALALAFRWPPAWQGGGGVTASLPGGSRGAVPARTADLGRAGSGARAAL